MSNNRTKVIVNAKQADTRLIKAASYSTVTFFDELQKRQVIVLYTLGEDGIVREYAGNKWNAYPITE